MPKVLVTPAKGLFQEAGDGTLSGHKKDVKVVTGNATLTLADSGKIIILGSAGTVQFPVTPGWHAEFHLTGSSEAVVSGSAISPGAGVGVRGREFGAAGTTNAVTIANGVGATFVAGAGNSANGDQLFVDVVSANLIHMKAFVAS